MPFLVEADITDLVAKPFIASTNVDTDYYLTLGDQYIESIAQAKGVLDFDDIATPLVIELKQYGLSKMYIELFGDLSNVNNNEAFEEDKYQMKERYYYEKAKNMAKVLTKEMITQTVQDKTDRGSFSFDLNRA